MTSPILSRFLYLAFSRSSCSFSGDFSGSITGDSIFFGFGLRSIMGCSILPLLGDDFPD